MWDDRYGDWDGHSALVIKGYHIPVVYWREVYGRLKSETSGKTWRVGDWRRIKGSWCEWKVGFYFLLSLKIVSNTYSLQMIVSRWHQSGEINFWKDFSDGRGHHLNYKAIVKRLTQIRITEDQRLADEARNHYGANFSKVFWYKKGGAFHVKTKNSDIAKQYRQLAKINQTDDCDKMDVESD